MFNGCRCACMHKLHSRLSTCPRFALLCRLSKERRQLVSVDMDTWTSIHHVLAVSQPPEITEKYRLGGGRSVHLYVQDLVKKAFLLSTTKNRAWNYPGTASKKVQKSRKAKETVFPIPSLLRT